MANPENPKTVPIRREYEAKDGLKLVLEDNSDGTIKAHLEENLETGGKSRLERLVNALKAITVVNSIKGGYIHGPNGEGEKKSIVELHIQDIRKSTKLEVILLKEIKLYRNMQETLKNRMVEIEKEKTAFPQTVLNDMDFYICLRFVKHKKIMELLELTDFLRTLYGVVKAKTEVTMEQILSNRKSPEISKERCIMMYITSYRFPFLSSIKIGKIFRKNHATVLIAKGQFSNYVGIKPEKYKDKRYEAEELYDDAKKKHEHYIENRSKIDYDSCLGYLDSNLKTQLIRDLKELERIIERELEVPIDGIYSTKRGVNIFFARTAVSGILTRKYPLSVETIAEMLKKRTESVINYLQKISMLKLEPQDYKNMESAFEKCLATYSGRKPYFGAQSRLFLLGMQGKS